MFLVNEKNKEAKNVFFFFRKKKTPTKKKNHGKKIIRQFNARRSFNPNFVCMINLQKKTKKKLFRLRNHLVFCLANNIYEKHIKCEQCMCHGNTNFTIDWWIYWKSQKMCVAVRNRYIRWRRLLSLMLMVNWTRFKFTAQSETHLIASFYI